MTVEERARTIIQRELGVRVFLHDDQSAPGMYDLRVGKRSAPEIAIECVRAVDPEWIETLKVGPAKGPRRFELRSDWNVELTPAARVKDVWRQIHEILRSLEQRETSWFLPVDHHLKRAYPDLAQELMDLKIASVTRFRTDGTGMVWLGLTGVGGPVDSEGQAVPRWVSEFLGAPGQADVLEKLNRSGAHECHVYVPVAPAGAPWQVESYLITDTPHLPVEMPILPPPVSQVWITYNERGVRWTGDMWQFFSAR